jgi:hypothetical protein
VQKFGRDFCLKLTGDNVLRRDEKCNREGDIFNNMESVEYMSI